MKPLLLYLCLPAILFQAIFASSSLNGSASLSKISQDIFARYIASLSSKKTAPFKSRKPHSKAKPAVGKLVCKKKLSKTKKKAQNKRGKSKDVLVKENESKLLIEFLLKELVEIVIGYLDDTYPIIVSTQNWILDEEPVIAIDSARLYVLTNGKRVKGLDHRILLFYLGKFTHTHPWSV